MKTLIRKPITKDIKTWVGIEEGTPTVKVAEVVTEVLVKVLTKVREEILGEALGEDPHSTTSLGGS